MVLHARVNTWISKYAYDKGRNTVSYMYCTCMTPLTLRNMWELITTALLFRVCCSCAFQCVYKESFSAAVYYSVDCILSTVFSAHCCPWYQYTVHNAWVTVCCAHSSQSTGMSSTTSPGGRPTATSTMTMVTSPELGTLAAPILAAVAVILYVEIYTCA